MSGAIDRLSELMAWVAHATDLEPDRPVTIDDGWARDLVGARLGPFVVTGLIGAGGMGVVLAARDEALDREVALKVLRPDLRARLALLDEARNAARLRHPRVAVVHAVGRDGDLDYIAMERIAGHSLRARIAEGLTAHEAKRVLTSIAEVLAFAHAQGMAHRDLKPENIMVEADGQVKLLDFGLSSPDGAATMFAAGTRGYIDPSLPAHRSDQRADIYAFGVIAFELFRGRLPTPGEPIRLPQVPWPDRLRLERLVARCIALDPARRPTASSLHRALSARAPRWPWLLLGVPLALALVLAWPSAEPARVLEKLTARVDEIPIELAEIAPDGSRVAWVDGQGLVLLDVATRETRRHPLPQELSFRYGRLSWLEGGRELELAHGRADTLDAFRVSQDGHIRRLAPAAHLPYVQAAAGYGVGLDRIEHSYFIVDPTGQRHTLKDLKAVFDRDLVLSPGGTRAAVIVSPTADTNVAELVLIDIASRSTETLLSTPRLLMENMQTALTFVGDDRLVVGMLEEDPTRGGNLWELEAKPGATPRRLTEWSGQHFGHLSATADGQKLALVTVVQQTDVWRAPLERDGPTVRLGAARRVTWDDADERPSAFASDGSLLYQLVRKGRPEARRLSFTGVGPAADIPLGEVSWPVEDHEGRLFGWRWDGELARLAVRVDDTWRDVVPPVTTTLTPGVGRPGPSSSWLRCPPDAACLLARDEGAAGIGFYRLIPESAGVSNSAHVIFNVTFVGYRPPNEHSAVLRWDAMRADQAFVVHGARWAVQPLSALGLASARAPCWPQYPAAGQGDLVAILSTTCVERPGFRLFALRDGPTFDELRSSDHRWMAHPVISPDGRWLAWAERAYQTDVALLDL